MDTGYIGHWGADDARTFDEDSGNQVSPATRRNRVRRQWRTHLYNVDTGNWISPAKRRNLVRRRWCTYFYNVDSGDRISPATRWNRVSEIWLCTLLYFLRWSVAQYSRNFRVFHLQTSLLCRISWFLPFLYLPSLGAKSDSCRLKTQRQRQKRTPDLSPTPPLEGSGSNLASVSVSDISFFNLGQPIRGGAGGWSPQWK